MASVLTQGSWCQNWIELPNTQLALENLVCKNHSFAIGKKDVTMGINNAYNNPKFYIMIERLVSEPRGDKSPD